MVLGHVAMFFVYCGSEAGQIQCLKNILWDLSEAYCEEVADDHLANLSGKQLEHWAAVLVVTLVLCHAVIWCLFIGLAGRRRYCSHFDR